MVLSDIYVNLKHCVDLQVYCPEPQSVRIELFDLLSDGRPVVHVGCRSAPSECDISDA